MQEIQPQPIRYYHSNAPHFDQCMDVFDKLRKLQQDIGNTFELFDIAAPSQELGSIYDNRHRKFQLPMGAYKRKSSSPCNENNQNIHIVLLSANHGLERFTSELHYAFLDHLRNKDLQHTITLRGVPIVNMSGFLYGQRSNAHGVDLLRDYDHEAPNPHWVSIGSGHRISPRIPYYRGKAGTIEFENRVIDAFLAHIHRQSDFTYVLDIHTGIPASKINIFKSGLWPPNTLTPEDPHQYYYHLLNQALASSYEQEDHPLTHQRQFAPAHYGSHGDSLDHRHRQFNPEDTKREHPMLLSTLEIPMPRTKGNHIIDTISRRINAIFNPPKKIQNTMTEAHVSLIDVLIETVSDPVFHEQYKQYF